MPTYLLSGGVLQQQKCPALCRKNWKCFLTKCNNIGTAHIFHLPLIFSRQKMHRYRDNSPQKVHPNIVDSQNLSDYQKVPVPSLSHFEKRFHSCTAGNSQNIFKISVTTLVSYPPYMYQIKLPS